MTSVPERAVILRKFSHIVVVRLRLSEPTKSVQTIDDSGLRPQWADAGLQILLQDTLSDTSESLVMLSAAMLYPGGAHAVHVHMATMQVAHDWLMHDLDAHVRQRSLSVQQLDEQRAKGRLDVEIVTHVPRDPQAKSAGGITLRANNEPAHLTVAQAADATNEAMVLALARAIADVRSKGVAAQSTPQPPAAKS